MATREHVLRVTIKDCEVQTFRAGGKGGQAQNKTDSGVRVIHPPSGARGESREGRSQLLNKRAAFRRMAESPEFQRWCREQTLPEAVRLENEGVRESARVGFGTNVRRNYVLDGRKHVIDPTTRHRTDDVQRVLDGDLDDFVRAAKRHAQGAGVG
jgi:protein subunit release factor B